MKMKHFRIHLLCTIVAILGVLLCVRVAAHGDADPLLAMVKVDKLEMRHGSDGDSLVLDGDSWLGRDLHKFWLKAKAERTGGDWQKAEVQALYSHAVAPFWDMQAGIRHDYRPGANKNWAVIGFQGMAPWFIDTNIALFAGESLDTGLRIALDHKLRLTQRLVLTPEFEAHFYGQNDARWGQGSGLSDLELGLRLGYEIRREFAPYIGIHHSRWFGEAATYRHSRGDGRSDTRLLAGIHFWF